MPFHEKAFSTVIIHFKNISHIVAFPELFEQQADICEWVE
jgi:hypothetical protein